MKVEVDLKGIKEELATEYKAEIASLRKIVESLQPKQTGKGITEGAPQEDWKKLIAPLLVHAPFKIKETITNAGSAIPEIWSDNLILLTQTKQVVANSPAIDWDDSLKGKPGDTLNFTCVSAISAGTVAPTGTTTATAVTLTGVPITLYENYAHVDVPKYVTEEAVPSLIDRINDRMAEALAFKLDGDILGKVVQASGTAGSITSTSMTGSALADAFGSVIASTYTPVVVFMHPKQYANLLRDTQFTNAATYGGREVIQTGVIPKYLGMDIVTTPKIGTTLITSGTVGGSYVAIMCAKGVFVGAAKRDVTVETDYDPTTRSTKVVATQRVGVALALAKGVACIGAVAA